MSWGAATVGGAGNNGFWDKPAARKHKDEWQVSDKSVIYIVPAICLVGHGDALGEAYDEVTEAVLE